MSHAGSLTPEQVRNLCVSFAKLGYFNTRFKSIMADAVIDKLGEYDPAMLADTAWAFGEAMYYDYDLMTNLHAYLKANAQKFDASGMAKVMIQGGAVAGGAGSRRTKGRRSRRSRSKGLRGPGERHNVGRETVC